MAIMARWERVLSIRRLQSNDRIHCSWGSWKYLLALCVKWDTELDGPLVRSSRVAQDCVPSVYMPRKLNGWDPKLCGQNYGRNGSILACPVPLHLPKSSKNLLMSTRVCEPPRAHRVSFRTAGLCVLWWAAVREGKSWKICDWKCLPFILKILIPQHVCN